MFKHRKNYGKHSVFARKLLNKNIRIRRFWDLCLKYEIIEIKKQKEEQQKNEMIEEINQIRKEAGSRRKLNV